MTSSCTYASRGIAPAVVASRAADDQAVIVVPDTDHAFTLGSLAVACSRQTTNFVALNLQILVPVLQPSVVQSLISTSVPAVIVVQDTVHATAYILSSAFLLKATTKRLEDNATVENVPSFTVALDTACSAQTVGVLCANVITLA